jgi:tetratricopeptide (TPR) repeat protein
MVGVGFALGMVTRLHEYRHVLAAGGGSVFEQLTVIDRVLIAGRVFWFYPSKIVWPANLAFMYPRWEVAADQLWQWLFPIAGLVLAVVLIVLLRRGRIGRGPVAAAVFYAVTIFPALGFVNVAPMRFSWVADHFQYLAALGTLLLLGALWSRLAGGAAAGRARSKRFLAVTIVAVALLGLLARASHQQAGIYHDLGTLWADTARKNPDSWLVQINHGVWLKTHGDLEGGAACYERAIEASPSPSEGAIIGYGNLASVRFVQGRYEESRQAAARCLAIKPDYPLALYNMGRALWKQGRLAEAEAPLKTLLGTTYDPATGRAAWDFRRRMDDARVWYVLAEVHAGQDEIEEALESYRRAVEISPAEVSLHNARLQALHRWGRTSEAIAATRLAVRHVRDNTQFRMQLALLLSVAAKPTDRNGIEALSLARGLVAQLGERNPHALSVLAAAQAELGRFAEATETVQRALRAAADAGDPGIQGRLQAQLASYSKSEPLHHAP